MPGRVRKKREGLFMRTLTIDRMEGIYAICTDKDKKYFAIPVSELPAGATAGAVLGVDDEEGAITLAKAAVPKRGRGKK